MTEVRIEHDGETFRIDVEELSSIEKMHFSARAPEELQELAEMENEQPVNQCSFNSDVIDYLIYVTTETTDFTEEQLEAMQMESLLELTSAVLEAALGEPDDDTHGGRCLKRVRCTQEFVEGLFTEKMAIVAGMPDDASFEDFEYDPSRNEFHFIFESDEWEPLSEGAEIPCHKAYSVGFGDSTKELSPADLSER